jgi:tetratricopeptide (TPR) repeat protein
MAAVDPYAPCPCGSGQKYKWCCQKVEAAADRAARLFDNGQIQAAFEAIDAALKKEPDSPLLLIRKTLFLATQEQPEEAKETLRRVFRKQPKHPGALLLLTRLVLETEGGVEAADQLQHALAAIDRAESSAALAQLVQHVAATLAEEGLFPAALKHIELARRIAPEDAGTSGQLPRMIESNSSVSAWQKDPYRPAGPPAGLPEEAHRRFAQALLGIEQGLWSAAAGAFELLSAEGPRASAIAVAADRNLGLCRLWLGEQAAAVGPLRRSIARASASPDATEQDRAEAVDLEALCQQIAPPCPDDQVELVQWIWPLRDRPGLLDRLGKDPSVHPAGSGPLEPDDPDSPEAEQFELLSGPQIEAARGLSPRDLRQIVGRLVVAQDTVALQSYDDGRLDALAERFTALAGGTIAPAHPRTKVLGKMPRDALALAWEWLPPEGLAPEEIARLRREQGSILVREVWPKTPMPYLRGRTPLAAAAAGDAAIPLRAAIFQMELTNESWRADVDFAALRALVKIGPEPAVDPETLDVEGVHLARLSLVPVERLDDERLVAFYRRAKRAMVAPALERASRVLIDRPDAAERGKVLPLEIYSGLGVVSAERGDLPAAFDWLRRGRQVDLAANRTRNNAVWDMLDMRLKVRTEPPQRWVPELAVILNRYRDDQVGNQAVVMALIDMGLVRLVAHPSRPDAVSIDQRPLEALMAEYGPRVTTISGEPGVSAARGEIWTPGSPTGGGAIWTPGSGSGSAPTAGAEKPKLIIPGR